MTGGFESKQTVLQFLTPDKVRRRRVDDLALWHFSQAVGACLQDYDQQNLLPACMLQAEFLMRPDQKPIVDVQQFGATRDIVQVLDQIKKQLEELESPLITGGCIAFVVQFAIRGGPSNPPEFAAMFSGLLPEDGQVVEKLFPEMTGKVIPEAERKKYLFEKPRARESGIKRIQRWLTGAIAAPEFVERFDPYEPLFVPLSQQIDLKAFWHWYSKLEDPEEVSPGTLANYFQLLGDLEKAEEQFSKLVAEAPLDERAYLARGQYFLETHDSKRALQDFDQAIALNKNFSFPRLMRARVLWELGAKEEAISEISRGIDVHPHFVEARMSAVRMLMACEQNELAMEAVQQVLLYDPHNPEGIGRWSCLHRLADEVESNRDVLTERVCHALKVHPNDCGLLFERAHLMLEAEDWDGVIGICNEISEKYPNDKIAPAMRAQAWFQKREYDKSLADYDLAIDPDSPNPWLLIWRARCRWALGELDTALMDVDLALDFVPDYPDALYVKGDLCLTRSDYGRALDCFEKLIELQQNNWSIHEKMGLALSGLNRFGDSIPAFRKAISLEPEQPSSHFYLALSLRNTKDFQGALASLTQADQIAPNHPPTMWERARLLAELNCSEESIKVLDRLLELSPDFPQAIHFRAALHQENKNFQAAEQDYSRLIQLFPDSGEAFVQRANMWAAEGDKNMAERDYQQAIDRNPEQAAQIRARQQLSMAGACHDSGDFDQAIDIVNELMAQDPLNRMARHVRGASLWYSERFVEAVEDFSWLLETSEETDWNSHSARGQVYAELGEFELAVSDLTRVIEESEGQIDPNLVGYSLSGRGFALAGLEKFEEAEKDFRESMKICPENAWLHYNIGRMHLNKGKPDQAALCFQLALNSNEPSLTPRQRAKTEGFLKSCNQGDQNESGPSSFCG